MLLAVNVARLVGQSLRFSIEGRRLSVLAVIVLGLAAIVVALSAQAAVPFAVYPFA